jgi:hypothetical protein
VTHYISRLRENGERLKIRGFYLNKPMESMHIATIRRVTITPAGYLPV